jgi:hypothetical protein
MLRGARLRDRENIAVPFNVALPHLFVAHDLEWNPLEMEAGEEILVQTFTLGEALAATRIDYRCDPEAALALWLYAGHTHAS